MKTILAIMSILALSACNEGGSASNDAALVPSTNGKIFIYGDDISTGQGVTTPYWQIIANRTGKTVVNRSYSNALGSNSLVAGQGPSLMSTVFNFSVSTSTAMNASITPNDVIIIFVGFNDVRWAGNTATLTQQFNDNFPQFLTLAYNTGAQIYVITPPKMKATSYAIAEVQNTVTLNQGSDAAMIAVRNLMATTVNTYGSSGVKLLDLQSTFVATDALLQTNSILPNDAGHAEIATELLTLGGI